MTVTLQIASLIALIALFAAWGSWVWEAHRPISSPEILGEVVVHGVDAAATEAVARALAVGVAGAVAEHYRTVDFINTAASTADEFLIRAGGSAPEPLLLQGKGGEERLDISVEVAGAKIDSKGLTSLFRREQRQRGALALAVSLVPSGEEGRWRAVASASFPDNSAYGFRIEASGAMDEIAQMIGLRFVQAHYAARDPFFAALGEEDFRKLWEVRREAAELALRGAGGDPAASDPLRAEARQEYGKVAHLLTRYRRRVELQKLGSYLATVQGDLTVARRHIEDAQKHTTDADERHDLDSLLASLDVEIENRAERTHRRVAVPLPNLEAEVPDDLLARLAEQNRPLIEALGLGPLRRDGALTRKPRIGIVLGRLPKAWDGRVTYVGAAEAPLDESLASYSTAVLSLVLALAPEAEIAVSPTAAGSGGSTSRPDLLRAISALAEQPLDVAFWPFGWSARSFGKEDGIAGWARSVGEQLDAVAGFGGLAVLPAGNDGVELPRPGAGSRAPVPAVIGAGDFDGAPRSYTNSGPGVNFIAPGDAVVAVEDGIAQQSGTGFSAAAFAAGAALLAATVEQPPGGARLRAVLSETARSGAEGAPPLPDFAAAAAALSQAPGG